METEGWVERDGIKEGSIREMGILYIYGNEQRA